MKLILPFTTAILICYCFFNSIRIAEAQTPTDATMMKPGQICFALSYINDSWDHYWEGTRYRDNGNIGTLTHHTIEPGFALGIIKHINIIGSLPFVISHPSAGQIQGDEGFPEFSLWVKGDLPELKFGSTRLHMLATIGGSVPVSHYAPDYAYGIGFGSSEASFRVITHYQLTKGFYLRGQGGYHLRGNSKLQRDYYYTTEGIYSDKVDMPDVIDYSGTLGWLSKNEKFKAEIIYDSFNCLSGFDIRTQDGGFPSNKMIWTRLGGGVKYFIPQISGLAVNAYAGQVLTGRNVGKSLVLQGGISYFFSIWNRSKNNSSIPEQK
ncbi:MAG: transporter [Chitinophagales bacterium]